MENQIVGVKFLSTSDYQDLLTMPSLISLTHNKTYAYISTGFDPQIGDLVIVPNSGYNEVPVVPAIVTNLNYQEGLKFATKPILAVIPQRKFKEQEKSALEVYQQLEIRDSIANELDLEYRRAKKLKKIKKMAKKNPEIAKLLQQLNEQDKIIANFKSSDFVLTGSLPYVSKYDKNNNNL